MILHPGIVLVDHSPLTQHTTQDYQEALRDFPLLPDMYMELLEKYGYAEFLFGDEEVGNTYTLRDPIEASEYYFRIIHAYDRASGMYPFAHGGGRTSLYYGEIKGTRGVFHCSDGYVHMDGMTYISPSLRDLLENGIGMEKLAELSN